jgi:hypothetical protein
MIGALVLPFVAGTYHPKRFASTEGSASTVK